MPSRKCYRHLSSTGRYICMMAEATGGMVWHVCNSMRACQERTFPGEVDCQWRLNCQLGQRCVTSSSAEMLQSEDAELRVEASSNGMLGVGVIGMTGRGWLG